MPKSKQKRGQKKRPGAAKPQRRPRWGGVVTKRQARRDYALFGVLLLGILAGGSYYLWDWFIAERTFRAMAEKSQAITDRVETVPVRGSGHVTSARLRYGDRFPTSGRHSPGWAEPGVYDSPQPEPLLVHALEHGNIVAYYDEPEPEARELLNDWAGLYGGRWSGMVVTPKPGLGRNVVLTAWGKRLRLSPFEAPAAAGFIDRFRGRGPEKAVR